MTEPASKPKQDLISALQEKSKQNEQGNQKVN